MNNPFVGTWTYRSFYNDPDITVDFDKLELGRGELVITEPSATTLGGKIGGPGWSLALHGSFGYGSPMQVRFQGRGLVGGEEWIYDYIGWLVPVWPSSTTQFQLPSIVGSVTRTISHSSSSGGVSPAGVVGSFTAVKHIP
jgi:hypothetical protein